jgi:DNA-binding transcriptional LysR family regulator
MNTLQSMKVFVRVAQRSGFAAAGRDLRMSPAAVTKHIAALEARVGARLFDRTTRSVGLTEVGRMYLERCLECLQAFEDADAFVGTLGNSPAGLLRVTAPVDLQNHLPTVVGRFMNEYPKVTVDLELSNRPIDLVEEGFDIAIRGASSLDGRFVAR